MAIRKKSQRTYTPCVLNDFISSSSFLSQGIAIDNLSIGQYGRERHIDYICGSYNNKIIAKEEELRLFELNISEFTLKPLVTSHSDRKIIQGRYRFK